MSQTKSIDFPAVAAHVRAVRQPFTANVARVLERDTAYQNERATRGGTVESAPTESAQRAVARIQADERRAVGEVVALIKQGAAAAHAALLAEATAAAQAFLSAHRKLAALEHNLRVFEQETGHERTLIGDVANGQDPDARGFLARATEFARATQFAARPHVTSGPLPEPDFDRVAS